MKISVIGYFPQSGPMSYGSISNWIANSWEFLGHEVIRIDRQQMDRLPKKQDIYFFVDCSEDYSLSMPNDLSGLKIHWAMDVQMPGGTERSVNIARKMDYTFCTNYEFGVKILEKFGIESMWVPYGYDYKLMDKVRESGVYVHDSNIGGRYDFDHIYDVCMIGNPNSSERVQLWNLLKGKYGERAVTGAIDTEKEYIDKKGQSYICISQPTEPFNTIINLRVWNALSCGKLLLCKRPTIKEHEILGLKDGVNVVYWDDFDDLIKKCDYYIEHRVEGRRIAGEGAKLGEKYLLNNSVRVIEQVIYSRYYNRLT